MKKAEEKKDAGVKLNWINDQFAVNNVRNFEAKNVCFFNLYVKSVIGNIAIYGCKVVSGKNGDFIAFPSQKGDNGNYYDVANVRLNDGISDAILAEVQKAI